MSDQPIVYRFTPRYEGDFLTGVPKRDLTQTDVNNMSGAQMRDAFAPHPDPQYGGKALYTPVETKEVADFSKVHEAIVDVITPEDDAAKKAVAEQKAKDEKAAATGKTKDKDGDA